MANQQPLTVFANPFTTAPPRINCPPEYVKHKQACYLFGSHSSYESARKTCENAGAKLASVESSYGKFIVDRVRSMGGNDFWIGSFIDKGRLYRQKGRLSCPIMRGQMVNNALYGMADCNSANRYVCQLYGPDNRKTLLNMQAQATSNTPAISSTTIAKDSETGGMSPVIYVVITIAILIAALIAVKLVIKRYFRDKKGEEGSSKKKKHEFKKTPKIQKNNSSKGQIFIPRRKGFDSKRTSIDSAVPPSNASGMSEKPFPEDRSRVKKDDDLIRMGRPRVNAPPPTRQPPGVSENYSYKRYEQELSHPRRHHSDPRSEYSDGRPIRKSFRRGRRGYYSDYTDSDTSDSESDDSTQSGAGFGPQKVYQRQPSRAQLHGDRYQYHINANPYGPARRHHRYQSAISTRKSRHHGPLYDNDDYYDDYRHPITVDGKIRRQRQEQQYQASHKQYFPEPHRLVSWANMAELNAFSLPTKPQAEEKRRSFPKEPIRVRREIHHKSETPQRRHSSGSTSASHIYESLDETKKSRKRKKASKKKKKRQKQEHTIQRRTESRASLRSIASIQSRRLPSPPL